MDTTGARLGQVFFDAVLHPHRSLHPIGFHLLMGIVTVFLLAIGTVFLLLGAWPVMGFCGLELAILYGAFRMNYRGGRAYEWVQLTESGLFVRRVAPDGGRGEWRFEPTWLRVDMDDPPRHESRLTLASHGRELVIGAFLTPEERLDLAHALKEALHLYRTRPPSPA
jgi:uncharacterized membrane protein